MATLPTIKRFLSEDFPGQSSWIGQLFFPLNLLLNTIYAALNNGITLAENAKTQVATLPVSGGNPTVSFPYKYSPASPVGVSIINTIQTNSPAVALTSAVGCTFSINNGIITARIQGLNARSSYNVTFVVWGG